MDRLTRRGKENKAFIYDYVHEANREGDVWCGRTVTRLAEYEDTGLSPEEIERMKSELAEYRKAKEEGRVIQSINDCKGCIYEPAIVSRRRCQECVRGYAIDNYFHKKDI